MNTWAWGVPPGMLAGGPGSREYIIVVIALWKEYHCCTFRGSIERRRVPQVRFLNLGLGVDILFLGLATAALRTPNLAPHLTEPPTRWTTLAIAPASRRSRRERRATLHMIRFTS